MRRAFLILLAGALAGACGGGGGDIALGPGEGGIGSGGTGVVAVVASGPVQGFGSIVVNGTRYETDTARFELRDTQQLKLGMTVQVTGTVSADLATGVANVVTSSAQLRGTVTGLDLAAHSFSVIGVRVQVDDATVIATGAGLADLADGTPVQVWGLHQAGGLLATRIERQASAIAEQLLTDTVRDLDAARRSFRLGGQQVRYEAGALQDGWQGGTLTAGQTARVRGQLDSGGVLVADRVEPADPAAPAAPSVLSLSGSVSQWDGRRFRLDGYTVDASAAKVTGPGGVREGARVEVLGPVQAGVLAASRIQLRGGKAEPAAPAASAPPAVAAAPGVPAAGAEPGSAPQTPETGAAPYSAKGTIGTLRADASFTVRDQEVDASGAQTRFVNGTRRDLQVGRKVEVTGARVLRDVLIADVVVFE